MNRDEARAHLPCLVAGDLADAPARQLEAHLATDPYIAGEREKILALRTVARRTLAREAPDLRERPAHREASVFGVILGLAAAVVLSLAVPMFEPLPEEVRLVEVARLAQPDGPGFVKTSDPGTLMAAFQAGGIGPTVSMVSDLSDLGMILEGGMVAPGNRPGTIAFYRKDGILWQCHMYSHVPGGGIPVLEREVEGVRLRAFSEGEMSWVVWKDGGMICVLAAAVDPEAVLAAVAAKIERASDKG